MRIALTVDPELPVPPLHYGGIERIVDMLAHSLAERGHEVTLFANAASTCSAKLISWPGASCASRLDTIRNSVKLARNIIAGGFDIVHSTSRIAYLTPLLPLPIPKLMSYHRNISPKTTALALRLSHGTLEFSALSQQMISAAPLLGRWHLTPNGVPISNYAFRKYVDISSPLVFLGRIEEIKGPHLAIEVARQTGRRLILAGNIPDEHQSWFDEHIAPNIDGEFIKYIGQVDDVQKNQLLGSCVALLMPILWEEPFGLVMAEAMACGTPVVGFRRGAVPEVIEDGVSGFVVDTIEEMVASLGQIDKLDRSLVRERVQIHYSDEVMVDRYVAIYEDMIMRSRSK